MRKLAQAERLIVTVGEGAGGCEEEEAGAASSKPSLDGVSSQCRDGTGEVGNAALDGSRRLAAGGERRHCAVCEVVHDMSEEGAGAGREDGGMESHLREREGSFSTEAAPIAGGGRLKQVSAMDVLGRLQYAPTDGVTEICVWRMRMMKEEWQTLGGWAWRRILFADTRERKDMYRK